jgi:hypothetical protein
VPAVHQPDQGRGQVVVGGRGGDLVDHHAQRLAIAGAGQHRLHEVLAPVRDQPRQAHDLVLGQQLAHDLLGGPLAGPVGVDRVGRVVFQ